MSDQNELKTKMYLRTKTDTEHKRRVQGQISGYVHVYNENAMGDRSVSNYTAQSITALKNVEYTKLGAWRHGYIGRVKSYQEYYALDRVGVTVAFGNVHKKIQNEHNCSKETVGCFIAAYDSHQMTFELHLPNGSIWQSTQVVQGITEDNAQMEFDRVAAELIGKKGKVRASNREPGNLGTARMNMVPKEITDKFKRTSFEKLSEVITCLQRGKTITSVVKETGVGKDTVERIKKELKALGKI